MKHNKRALFLSDFHTGHLFGLTPPTWWKECKDAKIARMEREAYGEYKRMVAAHGPYDVVCLLGDMIDGDGERSKASELITSQRTKQIQMVGDNLLVVKEYTHDGAKWFLTYGTSYHTGKGEDFEDILSDSKSLNVDLECGAHTWVEANGYTFDLKHHVGRSALPHGKYTPLARDAMWNELWAAHGGQPKGNAIVRGHTHYLAFCGDPNSFAITLPCLTWGSKFGARRCSEEIHWGIVWCDVSPDGKARWDWETVILDAQKPKKVRV